MQHLEADLVALETNLRQVAAKGRQALSDARAEHDKAQQAAIERVRAAAKEAAAQAAQAADAALQEAVAAAEVRVRREASAAADAAVRDAEAKAVRELQAAKDAHETALAVAKEGAQQARLECDQARAQASDALHELQEVRVAVTATPSPYPP